MFHASSPCTQSKLAIYVEIWYAQISGNTRTKNTHSHTHIFMLLCTPTHINRHPHYLSQTPPAHSHNSLIDRHNRTIMASCGCGNVSRVEYEPRAVIKRGLSNLQHLNIQTYEQTSLAKSVRVSWWKDWAHISLSLSLSLSLSHTHMHTHTHTHTHIHTLTWYPQWLESHPHCETAANELFACDIFQ